MPNIGQMELKLTSSNLSANTISNAWQLRKIRITKPNGTYSYPQGGQFLTLVITLENSHGVAQKHKGYNFRFPPHKFSSGRQSAFPQPPSTENTTIEFDKQHYIDGVVKVIGQLYEWSPSWQHTGLHGTEAMVGRPWSYPVTTTLNFTPLTVPTVTEPAAVTITEPAVVTITEPFLPEISFLPEAHAEPTPITSVLPAPTLSPKIKKLLDNWSVKKIIVL